MPEKKRVLNGKEELPPSANPATEAEQEEKELEELKEELEDGEADEGIPSFPIED